MRKSYLSLTHPEFRMRQNYFRISLSLSLSLLFLLARTPTYIFYIYMHIDVSPKDKIRVSILFVARVKLFHVTHPSVKKKIRFAYLRSIFIMYFVTYITSLLHIHTHTRTHTHVYAYMTCKCIICIKKKKQKFEIWLCVYKFLISKC